MRTASIARRWCAPRWRRSVNIVPGMADQLVERSALPGATRRRSISSEWVWVEVVRSRRAHRHRCERLLAGTVSGTGSPHPQTIARERRCHRHSPGSSQPLARNVLRTCAIYTVPACVDTWPPPAPFSSSFWLRVHPATAPAAMTHQLRTQAPRRPRPKHWRAILRLLTRPPLNLQRLNRPPLNPQRPNRPRRIRLSAIRPNRRLPRTSLTSRPLIAHSTCSFRAGTTQRLRRRSSCCFTDTPGAASPRRPTSTSNRSPSHADSCTSTRTAPSMRVVSSSGMPPTPAARSAPMYPTTRRTSSRSSSRCRPTTTSTRRRSSSPGTRTAASCRTAWHVAMPTRSRASRPSQGRPSPIPPTARPRSR